MVAGFFGKGTRSGRQLMRLVYFRIRLLLFLEAQCHKINIISRSPHFPYLLKLTPYDTPSVKNFSPKPPKNESIFAP